MIFEDLVLRFTTIVEDLTKVPDLLSAQVPHVAGGAQALFGRH